MDSVQPLHEIGNVKAKRGRPRNPIVEGVSVLCDPSLCRRSRWNFFYVMEGVRILKDCGIDPCGGRERGGFRIAQGVLRWFGLHFQHVDSGMLRCQVGGHGRVYRVPVKRLVPVLLKKAVELRAENCTIEEIILELQEWLESMLAASINVMRR